MNIEPLRQAVADVFEAVTGVTTILAHGTPSGIDQPREDKPYATVAEIVTAMPLGQTERFSAPAIAGNAAHTKRSHFMATFDVQVYGLNASDTIEQFRFDHIDYPHWELARTLGISVLDVGSTTDISSLLDTTHEERAQVDLAIGYLREVTEEVPAGTIDSVGIEGDLTGGPNPIDTDEVITP